MPIRARLTLWYASLLAAIIAGLGAFLVVQLRADLQAAVDRGLRDRAAQAIHEFEEEIADETTLSGVVKDLGNICDAAAPGAGTGAQLLSPSGEVLGSCGEGARLAGSVPASVRANAIAGTRRLITVEEAGDDDRWRVVVSPAEGVGAVAVAESLESVDEAVERVLVLLLLAGPAALALTALGGWWLARKALLPVERMTLRAREIGVDRLQERIPVPSSRDEINRLGITLNAMLDRLQGGFEEKHRLIADASHELRTPLAVMRAELDVSLRGDGLPDAAREVLESAREEVDKMARTVDNLLTLAQVDEGRLELLTTRLDLREAIEAAARPLMALAAAKEVRVVIGGERAPAKADPQRVHQALTNFVVNAIKYARHGGVVRVSSWRDGDEVGVTVTDDGPGVPAGAGDQVFDRFFRVRDGGKGAPGGSGLGLAICREVAIAHRGRVWVGSGPEGGSAFSLALPAAG